MRRSILTEPWQRSSRRAWALVVVVAAIGALIGISVRGLVLNAKASAPADPLAVVRSREPGLRVLFIGNSFTSFNSMPTMVEQLAGANRDTPRRLFAVEYAPGGSHLANAAHDPALLRLISSVHWDIVVLQEQSQVPALPYWLVHQSLPAVQTLTRLIRRDGARPVLFETWGYERGDLANFASDTYAAMQRRLHNGYAYLARRQHIVVVPVGETWSRALAEWPSLALWDNDGHHPSLDGSYLTAAAFNAAFDLLDPQWSDGADPALSTFTAGLDVNTAESIRQIAYGTVRKAFSSARAHS